MSGTAVSGIDVAALLARLAVHPRRITSDSRRADPSTAFAAYPGARQDGRAFIPEAVRRGAMAVLWEAQGHAWDRSIVVPNAPVEGLKAKLGTIADFVYGSPSRALWMVGVTGTNGKTSCTQWIAQALESEGRPAGVIGTLGNGRVGALVEAPNTTPDACVLQETLRTLADDGVEAVAMEVSSIGLDQGRVDGTSFDVALFTNLTRDHLDYHGSMAAYGRAKARLFEWPGLRQAVINVDDAFGQSLVDARRARGEPVLSYGLANADIAAESIATTPSGLSIDVVTPWGRGELRAPVVGTFNASNLLGVLGVLLASDVPMPRALHALAHLTPPPGRMQRVGGDGKPLVVVDYAHSPDALEQVLTAVRPSVLQGGALICVFGCGGDRDAGKRPQMGRIAATLADRVVVTSDNPRTEDPEAIASAIVHGVREAGNRHWVVELDRAKAIAAAVAGADVGDVIVVAGKGHEPYQEIRGIRTPFSDAGEATAALSAWGRA